MPVITTVEVAELLSVTTRTVARWARTGELPAAHKGNGVRGALFFEKEEAEFLAAQRKKARS